MSPRSLSLAHLTMLDQSFADLVAHAAGAGFTHVSPRIVSPFPTDPFAPVIGDEPQLREIGRRLRDTDVKVLEVEAVWLRPESDPDALVPVLETAARLGAPHLLTVGHDPDPARLRDRFARLGALARPYGITLMLEPITYCAVGTPAAALALIAGSGVPNAGLLVDALHLFRAGAGPEDVAAVPPSLIPYAQICDAPLAAPPMAERRAEAIGDRRLPGEGELPLAALLRALPRGIPLSVEAPDRRLLALPPAERARRAHAALTRVIASA